MSHQRNADAMHCFFFILFFWNFCRRQAEEINVYPVFQDKLIDSISLTDNWIISRICRLIFTFCCLYGTCKKEIKLYQLFFMRRLIFWIKIFWRGIAMHYWKFVEKKKCIFKIKIADHPRNSFDPIIHALITIIWMNRNWKEKKKYWL